ncbi:MAG: tetratricopeptide repeat protein [Alphaproteobacteria bacterium]
MRYQLLGLYIIGSVLFFTPVWAEEDMGAVLGRLADIEARLDSNEELLNAGNLPAAEGEASKPSIDLTNIIEKLNELTRRIQALEEKSGSVAAAPVAVSEKPIAAKDDDANDDVEAILMDLEKKATSKEGQVSEEKTKAMLNAEKTAPTLSKNDFESQYNESLGLLNKGEYKAAAASLEYCLKAFPGESKEDRVLYQLGKAYYGCKNYEQAKKSYAKAYRKNTKGAQAPHALFGLAQVFKIEGNKKNACATLEEIGKKYPQLDEKLAKDVAAAKSDCKG